MSKREHKNRTGNKLLIIGRIEKVDIPNWNIHGIEAKIDTGAYTSSLHCHCITPIADDKVRFNILDPSHEEYNDKTFELPIFKKKKVKSSNGMSEERIIIRTTLVLANKKFKAQLSLTDRSAMRYPLLIGRKLLSGHFLVDVSKENGKSLS